MYSRRGARHRLDISWEQGRGRGQDQMEEKRQAVSTRWKRRNIASVLSGDIGDRRILERRTIPRTNLGITNWNHMKKRSFNPCMGRCQQRIKKTLHSEHLKIQQNTKKIWNLKGSERRVQSLTTASGERGGGALIKGFVRPKPSWS